MTEDTTPEGGELMGGEEIGLALQGIVGLIAQGIPPTAFLRHIGLDPEAVATYAREAAEEEFATLPGMPPGMDATGRLRKLNLSANQRAKVKEALEETAIVALQLGASLELARLRDTIAKQEGDGPNE